MVWCYGSAGMHARGPGHLEAVQVIHVGSQPTVPSLFDDVGHPSSSARRDDGEQFPRPHVPEEAGWVGARTVRDRRIVLGSHARAVLSRKLLDGSGKLAPQVGFHELCGLKVDGGDGMAGLLGGASHMEAVAPRGHHTAFFRHRTPRLRDIRFLVCRVRVLPSGGGAGGSARWDMARVMGEQ